MTLYILEEGKNTPAARRGLLAAQLLSWPSLQEPFFLVEINCPLEVVGNVYEVMMKRKGRIEEENEVLRTSFVVMKGFLPVSESFGFLDFLREKTGGNAFLNCVFHHWKCMEGDVFDPGDRLGKIVR